MKISSSVLYALGISAVLAILTGCSSSSQSQLAPSGPTESGAAQPGTNPPAFGGLQDLNRIGHPSKGPSWIAPDAKSVKLLYISNSGNGTVNAYSWPKLNQLGTLTGLTEPYAMCVDEAQDVYVPDFAARDVVEYAHGSIIPVKTLKDSYGIPVACSIDPTTGNLAVGNFEGPSATPPGNVLIYAGAKGTPTEYTAPNITKYFFPAYDNNGNLFVDGENASYVVYLAELPKGKSAFKAIKLNQSIGFPGGVQWDGEYLAVGDQALNVIYQFTIKRSKGIREGTTTLDDAMDVFQFWITGGSKAHPQGTTVVGADFEDDAADVWIYPGGGTPTKTISSGFDAPEGAAISN
jgi:hypothetical protein